MTGCTPGHTCKGKKAPMDQVQTCVIQRVPLNRLAFSATSPSFPVLVLGVRGSSQTKEPRRWEREAS